MPLSGMIEKLTVGQYQDIYKVHKSDMDELDKLTEFVAILTGKTNREVEDMPMPEFKRLSTEISTLLNQSEFKARPKRFMNVNGKWWGITYEPKYLRTGQYLEIQHFTKGDIVDNLHLLMASLVYPIKKTWFGKKPGKNDSSKHEQVAYEMKDALFVDVYSACVFFCQLLRDSISVLTPFLMKEFKRLNLPERTLTDLMTSMDGFMQQNRWQISKE